MKYSSSKTGSYIIMNKVQELLRRAVFDAEVFTINARTQSPKLYDTRDEMIARVNRSEGAGANSISVELVASRGGWEVFTNCLMDGGLSVETRRWVVFNETLFRYDLYVEKQ